MKRPAFMDLRHATLFPDDVCHACGLDGPLVLLYLGDAQHWFCDADCLARWLAERRTLSEPQGESAAGREMS